MLRNGTSEFDGRAIGKRSKATTHLGHGEAVPDKEEYYSLLPQVIWIARMPVSNSLGQYLSPMPAAKGTYEGTNACIANDTPIFPDLVDAISA
jgi:hypothetical protein